MTRMVGPWHRDAHGYTVREFEPEKSGYVDVAAHALEASWVAFKVPFAASIETARGSAESIEDAMAKADAQLRAWGIEVQ